MTPALLVLAGETDGAARDFVARQARRGAVLVTPRDLSRPGWRLRVGDSASGVAVAGERTIPAREIAGVLTRFAAVTEADLPHIHREDRAYVAAEMTAFLLAFLSGLGARVANRPTAACLCGPAWSTAGWRQMARRLGFAAAPVRQIAAPGIGEVATETEAPGTIVTVLGGVCLDAPDPALATAALALAQAAEVDLLAAEFAVDGGLLGVRLVPELAAGSDAAMLGLFGLRNAA